MTKSKGRRLTTEESTLASAMYADGVSLGEIAKALEISREGAANHLEAKGEHVRIPCPRLSDAKRARVIDLYTRGMELEAIYNSTQTRPASVYRILRRAGIPLRTHEQQAI